jgi:hypothetical protein
MLVQLLLITTRIGTNNPLPGPNLNETIEEGLAMGSFGFEIFEVSRWREVENSKAP